MTRSALLPFIRPLSGICRALPTATLFAFTRSPSTVPSFFPGLPLLSGPHGADTRYHEAAECSLPVTSGHISLRPGMRVNEALRYAGNAAVPHENLHTFYVLDSEDRLLGVVSLRALLCAEDDAFIADVMQPSAAAACTSWPCSRIMETLLRSSLPALPLVNEHGVMLGLLTKDHPGKTTVSPSAAEETELDILHSPLFAMFRNRVFWLVFLTFFGVVTSSFVAAQEEMLSRVIVLAAFIAPIVDMGGNTGSQSATLVIRAMSVGDVSLCRTDLLRVLRRELPVACALGAAVSVMECVLSFFSKGLDTRLLMTVGLSMFTCTTVGSVIGLMLPFLARRMGADPATLSSPLITSIMDLLGVFIYFGFAWLLLGDMLV